MSWEHAVDARLRLRRLNGYKLMPWLTKPEPSLEEDNSPVDPVYARLVFIMCLAIANGVILIMVSI